MLPYPAEGRLRKRYARPLNLYDSIPVSRPKVQVFRNANGRAVSGSSGPSSIPTPSNRNTGTNLRLTRLESTAGTRHFHDAASEFFSPASSLGGTPTYSDARENYSFGERVQQAIPYAQGAYDVAAELGTRIGQQVQRDAGNIAAEVGSIARDGVLIPFGIAAGAIAPEVPGAVAGAGRAVAGEVSQFAGDAAEAARIAVGTGAIAARAGVEVAGILAQAAGDAARSSLSNRGQREWTEEELAYMRETGVTPEQAEAQIQSEQAPTPRSGLRMPNITMPQMPSLPSFPTFSLPSFGRSQRREPEPRFSGGQSSVIPQSTPVGSLFSFMCISSPFSFFS